MHPKQFIAGLALLLSPGLLMAEEVLSQEQIEIVEAFATGVINALEIFDAVWLRPTSK